MRRPLLQELRVRAVADLAEAAGVELGAHALAGADRHRALHDQDVARVGAHALELVDHAHHAREVGVAGVGRGRVDRDEDDVRAVEHPLQRERVGEPRGVLGHDVLEARLVDRDLPVVERRHLAGVDVAQGHLVPHGREADAGDQADVAGPDHPDALARGRRRVAHGRPVGRRLAVLRGRALRTGAAHGVEPSVSTVIAVSVRPFVSVARLSGRIDLAISCIVLALRSLFSVLDTQYVTPPDWNASRWRLFPS